MTSTQRSTMVQPHNRRYLPSLRQKPGKITFGIQGIGASSVTWKSCASVTASTSSPFPTLAARRPSSTC